MIEEGAVVTVMGRRQAPLESISPNFVVGDVSNTDGYRGQPDGGPPPVRVRRARPGREMGLDRHCRLHRGDCRRAVDADYNAAKAGLVMLTRSLSVRLGPHGVRANAVCPGWVRTPMGEEDMRKISEDVEEAYRKVTRFAPLRRAAEPEEVASAICYLASGDASCITGAVMMVDGGSTAVDVLVVDYEDV